MITRWWLVGAVLLTGVLLLALSFYANEVNRHAQRQRATQRQAVNAVRDDVDDVPVRERSLARVIQAVGRPTPPAVAGAGQHRDERARGDRPAVERVRTALELQRDEEFGAITVSAGVVIADHGSTAESLFQAADRALYEAKESGRNTTVARVATVT